MEHISEILKLIIDQSLANKNNIHELIINKLPIFYNIKTFISSYIQNLQLLTHIVNQNYSLSKRANDPQSVIHLFELIEKREINNLREWKAKLLDVENKYAGQSSNQKKFPDIFKDIDQDIEYYGILRKKIELLIEKKKTVEWERIINKSEKSKVNLLEENPEKWNEKYQKTNKFIEYYEKEYSIDLTSSKNNDNIKPESRQIGRIKAQCNTPKGSNQSTYNPMSLKENPINNRNRTYSYNTFDEIVGKTLSEDINKYEQYKINIQKEMLQITKNELKAENLKQNKKTNEKNINQTTASSSSSAKNFRLNKNICQTSPNSKKLMNGKKYTYLFDNKKEVSEFEINSEEKVKKRLLEEPHRNMTIESLELNDSLECIDQVASKLEEDTTENEQKETKDIELILISSLLSSKKWDFRDLDEQSNEDSEKDSLDELRENISATGRFPLLYEGQSVYRARNRLNEDDEEDGIEEMTHPYRPVTHSLSKLNFSFGSS